MAKGQIAKQEILNKILETFEGAFLYNDGKEIRVPIQENGELVQIKINLTCAKTNVEQGDDNALPGEKIENTKIQNNFNEENYVEIKPTEEEKQNVRDLLASFGL